MFARLRATLDRQDRAVAPNWVFTMILGGNDLAVIGQQQR